MNQKSVEDGATASKDYMNITNIQEIEDYIKRIHWNIVALTNKKNQCMSLTQFYNYGKQIRAERYKAANAIKHYIKLEKQNDLPVKLEYRKMLKKWGQ